MVINVVTRDIYEIPVETLFDPIAGTTACNFRSIFFRTKSNRNDWFGQTA